MAATGADVSVLFVPPPFTKAAVIEAVDAGMSLAVIITEGVPVADTAEFFAPYFAGRVEARGAQRGLVGEHRPGLADGAVVAGEQLFVGGVLGIAADDRAAAGEDNAVHAGVEGGFEDICRALDIGVLDGSVVIADVGG